MANYFDDYIDFISLLLIFILYPLAANNMNLVFTTFFSRSKFAGEITIFLNVLAYSSYGFYLILNFQELILGYDYEDDSWFNKSVKYDMMTHFLSLIPAFAFCEGLWRIGMQKDEHNTFGPYMLIIDILLYLLIFYYFDNVLPNRYGVKKSCCFCCSCKKKKKEVKYGFLAVEEEEDLLEV